MPSYTQTNVVTTSALNIQEVMTLLSTEGAAIARAVSSITGPYDIDGALRDVSILTLNNVASRIMIQIFLGDQIVREYRYEVVTDARSSYGPPAHQPPIGYIPDGCRMRVAIGKNPRMAPDYVAAWLRRLGWEDASPLHYPAGTQSREYGAFASGNFGLTRNLLTNPQYDRPAQSGSSSAMRREDR